MSQQTINIGTAPNDGTGDPLRTALDKANDNFTELYAADETFLALVNGKPSLGETSSTAYRGDRGKSAYDFSQTATTAGAAFVALTNPGAITFVRINADNSVTALSASSFRTAIGAGTSNFDGAYSSLTGKPDLSVAAITSGAITGTPISGSTGSFSACLSGYFQSDDGGGFIWASRSQIKSPANGQIAFLNANGSKVVTLEVVATDTLALRNSTAEQTLIVGPSSTGIRSNAGELEAFDNAGNISIISPHAKDAPPALYEIGPGVDEMLRRANIYLCTIQWWATTRRQALDVLDLAARTGTHEESVAAWAEFAARKTSGRTQCAQVETFAGYEQRTGRSLVPADQDHDWWLAHTAAERWAKVESDRVAKSVADREAWQARKDAADAAVTAWSALPAEGRPPQPAAFTEQEPALYVTQEAPAWCAA